jgi:hypothetical protein
MGAARRNIAYNGSPRFALCALRCKDPLPSAPAPYTIREGQRADVETVHAPFSQLTLVLKPVVVLK